MVKKIINLYDFVRHLYVTGNEIAIRYLNDNLLYFGPVKDSQREFEREHGSMCYYEVYEIDAAEEDEDAVTDGPILVKVYDRRSCHQMYVEHDSSGCWREEPTRVFSASDPLANEFEAVSVSDRYSVDDSKYIVDTNWIDWESGRVRKPEYGCINYKEYYYLGPGGHDDIRDSIQFNDQDLVAPEQDTLYYVDKKKYEQFMKYCKKPNVSRR